MLGSGLGRMAVVLALLAPLGRTVDGSRMAEVLALLAPAAPLGRAVDGGSAPLGSASADRLGSVPRSQNVVNFCSKIDGNHKGLNLY